MGVAAVTGWSVAEKIEPKINKIWAWVILPGLIGARAYHVLDLWEYYRENLGQIIAVWNGGLGIFGGIAGGVVGILIYQRIKLPKRERREFFWRVTGALAAGMPLSQAIGRWANLANNELWGRNHEPLFLYESILDLILFYWVWRVSLPGDSRKAVGRYALGYGVIRLLLEPLKPEPWIAGYFAAMILVIVGGTILTWRQSSVPE